MTEIYPDEKIRFDYSEYNTDYMKAVWGAWIKDKEHLSQETKVQIQAQWIKGELALLLYNLP